MGNTAYKVHLTQKHMVIKELRTGYRRLHNYGHNKDQQLMPLCKCGEEETNKYYLDRVANIIKKEENWQTKYKPVMQKWIRGNYKQEPRKI